MTDEELRECVDQHVKEHFKPKVLEKRVRVDPEVAVKVYAYLNKPPTQKKTTLKLRPHTDKGPLAKTKKK